MLELFTLIDLNEAKIQDWALISTEVLAANIKYVLQPQLIKNVSPVTFEFRQHRISANSDRLPIIAMPQC